MIKKLAVGKKKAYVRLTSTDCANLRLFGRGRAGIVRQKKPKVGIRGDFLPTFLWQKKVGIKLLESVVTFCLLFYGRKK